MTPGSIFDLKNIEAVNEPEKNLPSRMQQKAPTQPGTSPTLFDEKHVAGLLCA